MLRRSMVFGLVALLACCSPAAGNETRASAMPGIDIKIIEQVDAMYGELVLAKDAQLIARFPKGFLGDDGVEQLRELRARVPEGPADAAVVVAWHTLNHPDTSELQIIHRYDYKDRSVLMIAGFTRAKGDAARTLIGFSLAPAQQDAMEAMTLGRAKSPPPEKPEAT